MKKKSTYKIHVKAHDRIKVISGKEKGKIGIVKKLLKKENKIIVEKINIKYKHIKRTKNYETGKIKKIEFPIHSSNVVKWDE
jgi:large subunit ribosomal protein L24